MGRSWRKDRTSGLYLILNRDYQIKHKASPECPPRLFWLTGMAGELRSPTEDARLTPLMISRWLKIPSDVDINKVLVSPQFCSCEYFKIRLILI